MNKRRVLFAVLLLLSVTVLYARGNKEKDNNENTYRLVQAEGVVRLVGSEPFSELVISGQDGSWYIAQDENYKLHDLQHRLVTVEGEETSVELTFASGLPAGTRRYLRNIRIISVN